MGVNKKVNREDVHQFVTEDLISKIAGEQEALKKLKFTHAVSTLTNPVSIRAKKRDVARLMTELSNRKKENKA